MCVACHMQTDAEYPSLLLLGNTEDSCGDCHMKEEAVDVSWVAEMDKAVHLEVRGEGGAGEAARAKAEAMASEALLARGFRLVAKEEAVLTLILALRVRALHGGRFLPPGTPVRMALLDMTIGAPGEAGPYVRRLGSSKPEWGATEDEAVSRAVRDAWAVLSPHLLEALSNN